MAKDKPDTVNTCTVADCIPINEDSPQWFDHHMACWCCNRDDNRHDLMWHVESFAYFHKMCLLYRTRQQAMDACTADSPLSDYLTLRDASIKLQEHRVLMSSKGLYNWGAD